MKQIEYLAEHTGPEGTFFYGYESRAMLIIDIQLMSHEGTNYTKILKLHPDPKVVMYKEITQEDLNKE